jgi:hypothetical protein
LSTITMPSSYRFGVAMSQEIGIAPDSRSHAPAALSWRRAQLATLLLPAPSGTDLEVALSRRMTASGHNQPRRPRS